MTFMGWGVAVSQSQVMAEDWGGRMGAVGATGVLGVRAEILTVSFISGRQGAKAAR
jgi:hypothetical protein